MSEPGIRPQASFLILCLMTASVLAQEAPMEGMAEFSLGVGYANVSLSSSDVIDNEGALRFEPAITFSPIRDLPQFRLGADVGVTLVLDNSSRTIISGDDGLIYTGSSDIPLWLLEPEVRLSWRQFFGEHKQFFIEPGLAGGVAFGFLDLDSTTGDSDSYDASDCTVFGRVSLRAGAQVTGGIAGIEASWLAGDNLDLGGNASGDLNMLYIGIFGALMF